MLRIEQTYFINAAPERVWAALTDAALMTKWTGTAAQYEARVGGAYALWDDYVRGEVVVCDPPKQLAQTWQPNNWAIQDSVVTLTLRKSRGGTRLDLTHENVQPEDYDGTNVRTDVVYDDPTVPQGPAGRRSLLDYESAEEEELRKRQN